MHTQHPNDVGVPSFRDESYKERGMPLETRWVSYAHGIKTIDENGNVNRDKTTGDIQGAAFARPAGDRKIGSWWHGIPVVKSGSGFIPIRDKSFTGDKNYEIIEAAVKDGYEVAEGSIGIICAATKEDGEQELIFMGGGDVAQKLLAPNRNGSYLSGTEVFDLNSVGEPDIENHAHLQSFWKVMRPNYDTGSGQQALFGQFAVGAFGGVPGGLTLQEPSQDGSGTINVGFLDGPSSPFGDDILGDFGVQPAGQGPQSPFGNDLLGDFGLQDGQPGLNFGPGIPLPANYGSTDTPLFGQPSE